MRKNHRSLIVFSALILCLAIALSALAEGAVSTLYKAGTQLLFDTDNAAISAHAEFSYNGMPFKTADLSYLQDGVNSQLQLKLLTPKDDGEIFESGFTVVGNGGTAYAIDPVDNPYVYQTSSCAESSSILSGSSLRRALVRLGGAVVSATESAFDGNITVSSQKNATQYHVEIKQGDTSALVNAAGTLLWQLAAERYFYVDYDYLGMMQNAPEDKQVTVIYDDYQATLEGQYQRLFGEKMPEDLYEKLWSDDKEDAWVSERYQQTQDALYETVIEPVHETYTTGVALIRRDGSVDYYETIDNYYVENDLQMVDFANFDAAYCAFYQKVTGSELPLEDLQAVYHTDNEDLIAAYLDIYEQMMNEYMDLVRGDGKASLIYVNADGSYRMIYDYEAYCRSYVYGETMTRHILFNMEEVELGDSDFTITLDDEGRVTAAKGVLGLVVIDADGYSNSLEIAFDVTVDQYGQTHVGDFDPAAFGVMSYAEFIEKGVDALPSQQDQEEVKLPQTITFDGVSYQLILDEPTEGDL